MSNQNNNRNPPQPSPQNIQVTSNIQGPIGTAYSAGIVHGGVGNTYNTVFNMQASSDVEERGTAATVREADGRVPHQGVTQNDSNPLLDACRKGNMAMVKRVLDLGQVDVNCKGEWNRTPVMEAALGGIQRRGGALAE
ncbi:uncharacterized protein LOC124291931 [Haliotis rubra]|uniref:uncharacterized protein LOC124291931 n=1 Tax=Haliotis rubra TaxID=36100 RepID=UPI001EE59DA0|nr:uncharacterized protein LOC124291931 [Haliotis rubra]